MTRILPASLKLTVLLVLLSFAVALSALNLIFQVPRAERAVEEEHRERLLQELSRLQSTLEYLLLKGDVAESWREGRSEYATVAMRFAMRDWTTDAAGRVVEGDLERPTEVTELWTFVRERGGPWRLAAIQQG